jgi:hypothetical protein
MTRKDCLAAYQDFSAQTSENVRNLSFAAIAVIWVFRVEPSDGGFALSSPLLAAGTASVLALMLDFLQYAYATIAWGRFHRIKELEGASIDSEFSAPARINWPTLFLFWAKVASVAVAYGILLGFLVRRLLPACAGAS